MIVAKRYEGTGDTIEAALEAAHMQIPPSEGSDVTISKVVDWGMQYGGFVPATLFYVIVEQDLDAPIRTQAAGQGG
jgi:hypothetical protein